MAIRHHRTQLLCFGTLHDICEGIPQIRDQLVGSFDVKTSLHIVTTFQWTEETDMATFFLPRATLAEFVQKEYQVAFFDHMWWRVTSKGEQHKFDVPDPVTVDDTSFQSHPARRLSRLAQLTPATKPSSYRQSQRTKCRGSTMSSKTSSMNGFPMARLPVTQRTALCNEENYSAKATRTCCILQMSRHVYDLTDILLAHCASDVVPAPLRFANLTVVRSSCIWHEAGI